MSHGRRRPSLAGPLVAGLVLVAGCGGSTAPAEDVPALAPALARIDDAVVAGRYDAAREHVDELVATTTQARDDGRLETSEADRILAAAARLVSALPDPGETRAPGPTEPPRATPTPGGPVDEEPGMGETDPGEEEREEREEEPEEEPEEERKKEADDRKKEESKGGGNGDSEDNGPDDGEGN